jgi:hypothetical protein
MKSLSGQVLSVLAKLEPLSIERFLVHRGFQRVDADSSERVAVWRSKNADGELVVPHKRETSDYARVLLGVLTYFETEDLSLDDLLVQATVGPCDVERYSTSDADTKWGSAGFERAVDIVSGLGDLIKYSAAGLLSQKRNYAGVPEEAKHLWEGCRVGQTEIGSFVVKVYCPLSPIVAAKDAEESDSLFGRQVLRACAENFAFFCNIESIDEESPLPATINANVAAAVARLGTDPQFVDGFLKTVFVHTVHETGTPDPIVHAIDPMMFQRAAWVLEQIRRSEHLEMETLYGYITDLHMDPPSSGHSVNYEIRLRCAPRGGTDRVIRLPVTLSKYRKATQWQQAKQEVRLQAIFDKQFRQWKIHEVLDFSALPKRKNDAPLFSNRDA